MDDGILAWYWVPGELVCRHGTEFSAILSSLSRCAMLDKTQILPSFGASTWNVAQQHAVEITVGLLCTVRNSIIDCDTNWPQHRTMAEQHDDCYTCRLVLDGCSTVTVGSRRGLYKTALCLHCSHWTKSDNPSGKGHSTILSVTQRENKQVLCWRNADEISLQYTQRWKTHNSHCRSPVHCQTKSAVSALLNCWEGMWQSCILLSRKYCLKYLALCPKSRTVKYFGTQFNSSAALVRKN